MYVYIYITWNISRDMVYSRKYITYTTIKIIPECHAHTIVFELLILINIQFIYVEV